MSGENPYATPQSLSTGLPDAPESFGWELVGNRVWAERFAQLPMVDPYSGESDEVMTMNRLTVRLGPLWYRVVRWVCVALVFQPLIRMFDDELSEGMALVGLLGFFISIITSMLFPVCGLKVFLTSKTLRRRAIQHWTINGCFVLGILMVLIPENSGLITRRFSPSWISGTLFGLWVLGLVWKALIQRQLTCRRRKDGKFEIRGFHPKAIEQLRTNQ